MKAQNEYGTEWCQMSACDREHDSVAAGAATGKRRRAKQRQGPGEREERQAQRRALDLVLEPDLEHAR